MKSNKIAPTIAATVILLRKAHEVCFECYSYIVNVYVCDDRQPKKRIAGFKTTETLTTCIDRLGIRRNHR